jgi:virginiamycin B lyase
MILTVSRMRRVGLASAAISALILGGLIAATPAQAAPGDVPIQVDVPTTGGGLTLLLSDIVTAPDGNVWTTNVNSNSISRVALTGGLATTYVTPTAGTPAGITVGPDGALWFTYYSAPKIGRISTSGAFSEYPIPSGTGAIDIAAGSDGNLWYTGVGNQKIGRITPGGTVTEFATGGLNGGFITPGPTGSDRLYVSFFGTNKVGFITTTGNVNTITLGADVTQPWYIRTVGNVVWFIEQKAGSTAVARLIADTTVQETVLPASNPTNITPGEAGAFYIMDYGASKVLAMSSAGAVANTYSLPAAAIAGTLAPDGNLWLRSAVKVMQMLTGQVPALQTAPGLGPTSGVVPGTVITTSNGAWRYLPTSYAYQWQRCTSSDASTCANIAGATGQSYTATGDDNGKYVRAGVTATNGNGASTPAYTAILSVGSAAPPAPPAPPAPATGPDVNIGSGVLASLDGPASLRRNARGTFDVSFTALDVAGTVTFKFVRGSKSKTIANVNVSGGQAKIVWRVPRNWPKGTTVLFATYTPPTGSPYAAGSMRMNERIR